MRAYIKISPHAIPPFARVQSLSQKKAPSSQKKASARQKRKDQELYLNLYVAPVVFVVPVVVLFSDHRAAFSPLSPMTTLLKNILAFLLPMKALDAMDLSPDDRRPLEEQLLYTPFRTFEELATRHNSTTLPEMCTAVLSDLPKESHVAIANISFFFIASMIDKATTEKNNLQPENINEIRHYLQPEDINEIRHYLFKKGLKDDEYFHNVVLLIYFILYTKKDPGVTLTVSLSMFKTYIMSNDRLMNRIKDIKKNIPEEWKFNIDLSPTPLRPEELYDIHFGFAWFNVTKKYDEKVIQNILLRYDNQEDRMAVLDLIYSFFSKVCSIRKRLWKRNQYGRLRKWILEANTRDIIEQKDKVSLEMEKEIENLKKQVVALNAEKHQLLTQQRHNVKTESVETRRTRTDTLSKCFTVEAIINSVQNSNDVVYSEAVLTLFKDLTKSVRTKQKNEKIKFIEDHITYLKRKEPAIESYNQYGGTFISEVRNQS